MPRGRAPSERITESSPVAPRRPARRARFYVAPALRVKPRQDETIDSVLRRRCWRRYDWPHSLQRAEPRHPIGSEAQLLARAISREQPCLRKEAGLFSVPSRRVAIGKLPSALPCFRRVVCLQISNNLLRRILRNGGSVSLDHFIEFRFPRGRRERRLHGDVTRGMARVAVALGFFHTVARLQIGRVCRKRI